MNNIPHMSSFLSNFVTLVTLCITLFTNSSLSAKNLNPLQDFCVADLQAAPTNNGFPCKSHVSSEDFFFSGLNTPFNTSNPRGVAANQANLLTFPALNTMGLSMYNVFMEVDGFNPPHYHPSATEAGVVLEGSVMVAFLTTNHTLFTGVGGPGDMFVVPPGLIHYEWNVRKTQARFLAVVADEMPAEVVLPQTLFTTKPPIPKTVLMKAFNTDGKTIDKLKSKFIT